MKKKIMLIGLFLLSVNLFADTRTDNIDIIIALDKSLSMVEEIESVKEFFRNDVLEDIIIPGDRLILINFYGKTEIHHFGTVGEDNSVQYIENVIKTLKANGLYTDIGNALDILGEQLESLQSTGRKKYLMLLTDGKQEAPPESQYYSPDYSIDHDFLQNSREIRKQGWKVLVLGIGNETAAKELAGDLAGTYEKVPEKAEASDFAKQTSEFLSVIESELVSKQVRIGTKTMKTAIRLRLDTEGYEDSTTITVTGVKLETGEGIIESEAVSVPITVFPEQQTTVTVPVTLSQLPDMPSGPAVLHFYFGEQGGFTPASFDVGYTLIKPFPFGILLIIAAILLAGLVIFLIVRRMLANKPSVIKFKLEVDRRKLPRVFSVTEGESVYAVESFGSVDISTSKEGEYIAEISAKENQLRVAVSDDVKSLTSSPKKGKAIGWEGKIRTLKGTKFTIKITSAE